MPTKITSETNKGVLRICLVAPPTVYIYTPPHQKPSPRPIRGSYGPFCSLAVLFSPPTVSFSHPTVSFSPPTVSFSPPTVSFSPPTVHWLLLQSTGSYYSLLFSSYSPLAPPTVHEVWLKILKNWGLMGGRGLSH